jgi:cytoskeletal protein RodZ
VQDHPPSAFRHIGSTLREARERRGWTLRGIATATNIPIPVLEAVERGDLTRVPGGIFVRAHLRAFALQVGVDPEQILAEYRAHDEVAWEGQALRELQIRCANRGARHRGVWLGPALLAAALTLILYHMILGGPAEPPIDPGIKSVPAADEPDRPRGAPVAQLNDA